MWAGKEIENENKKKKMQTEDTKPTYKNNIKHTKREQGKENESRIKLFRGDTKRNTRTRKLNRKKN